MLSAGFFQRLVGSIALLNRLLIAALCLPVFAAYAVFTDACLFNGSIEQFKLRLLKLVITGIGQRHFGLCFADFEFVKLGVVAVAQGMNLCFVVGLNVLERFPLLLLLLAAFFCSFLAGCRQFFYLGT